MYVHAWGWMNTTDVPNHRRGDRGTRGARPARVRVAGPRGQRIDRRARGTARIYIYIGLYREIITE